MQEYEFRNESSYIRAKKDADHPYNMVPAYFNDHNLYDGYERAILSELSSNRDDFIIVKSVIRKRLGFGRKHFETAWKSLEDKRHIFTDRIQGGWKHVYSEIGKYGEEDLSYHNMKDEEPSQLIDNQSNHAVQHVEMQHVENTEIPELSQLIDNQSNHSVQHADLHNAKLGDKQVLKRMSSKEERPEISKSGNEGSKPGFVINDNFFSSSKDLIEDLGCNLNIRNEDF